MNMNKKIYIVPETACEQFLNYKEIMDTTPGTMGGGAGDASTDDNDFHAPKKRDVF